MSHSHVLKTCGVFSLLLSPAQFRGKSTMNPILSLILCVVNRAREDKIEFHDIYYEMCLSRVICAFAMSTLVSPRTRKPSRIDKKKNVSILCRYMFVQDAKIEASSKSRRLLSILSSPKLFESIISGSSSSFDVDTMNHLARFGCRCNFSILVHTYSGIFNTRTPTNTGIEKMEQEESYVKAVVCSFLAGKPLFLSSSSSPSSSSDRISALSSDVAFFFVFLGRQYEYVRGDRACLSLQHALRCQSTRTTTHSLSLIAYLLLIQSLEYAYEHTGTKTMRT